MNLDTPDWQVAEAPIDRAIEHNPRFARIIAHHVPKALRRFADKSIDYDDAASELGPAAQFVDINRKIKKLRKALWLGQRLEGEQPVELLDDLIGHCLLAREMLVWEQGQTEHVAPGRPQTVE